MNDLNLPDDLDALVRETLSQEPSPAFVPRVRARVARERFAAPSWHWLRVPVALAAACALFIVATPFTDDEVVLPPAPRPPLHARATAPPPLPDPARVPLPPSAPVVRRQAPSSRGTGDAVVVDPRQRAAIGVYLRLVEEGALTPETFAATTPPSLRPIDEHVQSIGLTPVAVNPIQVGGVLQAGIEK